MSEIGGRTGKDSASAEKTRAELLTELSSAPVVAQQLETKFRDAMRSARLVRDIAGPMRDAVAAVPADALSPTELARTLEQWRAWSTARGVTGIVSVPLNALSSASLLVANTSSTGIIMLSRAAEERRHHGIGRVGVAADDAAKLSGAVSQFNGVLQRAPLAESARAAMSRLRLDSRLLDEAERALAAPVFGEGTAVSVLIPLRECINRSIAELLRHRPTQEPARKVEDQVLSIGRHCSRPGLPDGHFEELGVQARTLLDTLSATKQKDIPRRELSALFSRAVLFLAVFLESLERGRLRS